MLTAPGFYRLACIDNGMEASLDEGYWHQRKFAQAMIDRRMVRGIFGSTNRFRTAKRLASATILSLCVAGCSRRVDDERDSVATTPPTNTAVQASAPSTPTTAAPSKDPIGIERDIHAQSASQKLAAITRTSRQDPQGALNELQILFQSGPDVEVKVTILDAMLEIKHSNTVSALALGLAPRQPREVRLAAINALLFADDPAAIPYLKSLSSDPDTEIRDEAAKAVEFIETPPMTTEQFRELIKPKQ